MPPKSIPWLNSAKIVLIMKEGAREIADYRHLDLLHRKEYG
jgi:hypothetical protein